jgi:hypothetical protein
VREKDLKLFADMAKEAEPAKPEDLSLRVLVPAFMIPNSNALSKSVSLVPAITDHRPCCGLGAHVDRHDDAATRVVSLPFELISCWVDAGVFLRAG